VMWNVLGGDEDCPVVPDVIHSTVEELNIRKSVIPLSKPRISA
jgi:hypothetical protein